MKKRMLFIIFLFAACQPLQIEKNLEFKGVPEDIEASGSLECHNQFGVLSSDKSQSLGNKRRTKIVLFEDSTCWITYITDGYGSYKKVFNVDSSSEQTVTLERQYATITIDMD